jgi:thioredoxin reductase (NADPH)
LKTTMSQYLIDQIEASDNISLMVHTEITAAVGADRLESITLKNNQTGDIETVPADAIFIFIGAVPHTDIVAGIVERSDAGFILTGPDLIRDGRRPKTWKLQRDPFLMETSVPGIFAAGDVRHGVIRRVASAVGQGAIAVSLIHKYLETV